MIIQTFFKDRDNQNWKEEIMILIKVEDMGMEMYIMQFCDPL